MDSRTTEGRCYRCGGVGNHTEDAPLAICVQAMALRLSALEAAGKVPGGACATCRIGSHDDCLGEEFGTACACPCVDGTMPQPAPGLCTRCEDGKHAECFGHCACPCVDGTMPQPAPEAGRCDERCVGWCSAHIAKGGDPLMHRRAVQGQESDFMWPCPDWRCDGSGPAHQPAPAVTRESWLPAVGTVVGADLEAGTVTIEVDGGFVERGVHGGRVSISRLDAKIPA